MMRRNYWKRLQATSVSHAMELLIQHAKEVKGLSVDQVADLIGLTNKYMIYKWIESGRIPAILIRPFEHACGATYLTDYLGTSALKILIDIPRGRKVSAVDIAELQRSFSYAVQHLSEFYTGDRDRAETIATLDEVLHGVAWHRANVANHETPELALFEGEDR